MTLTTEDFKNNIFDFENNEKWTFKGNKDTIIKFETSWCSPCKSYSPIYEKVSLETLNVNFYTIDADDEPEIAQYFNIRSVPTTIFISKNGTPPYKIPGILSRENLNQKIVEFFKNME